MDFVLSHMLMYTCVGTVMMGVFSYLNTLNLSIGHTMILLGIAILNTIQYDDLYMSSMIALGVMGCFVGFHWITIHFFPDHKARELFWIVGSLALAIVLENFIGLYYGSTAFTVDLRIPTYVIGGCLATIILLNTFIFRLSFHGKIFHTLHEDQQVSKALGIHTKKYIHFFSVFCLLLLVVLSCILLSKSGLRANDGMYYNIKWVGMLILIGAGRLHHVWIGALIYTLLEYGLFVVLSMSTSLKESIMLLVILLLLLVRPKGIFGNHLLRKH